MSPSPSSNRTCGFPASGSPEVSHRRHSQKQRRNVGSCLAFSASFRLKEESFGGRPGSVVVGFAPNRTSSSLTETMSSVGSLRSTGVNRFLATMDPSDSQRNRGTVMDSRSALNPTMGGTHPVGSPRFLTDQSARAVPNHPGGPGQMHIPVASPSGGRLHRLRRTGQPHFV